MLRDILIESIFQVIFWAFDNASFSYGGCQLAELGIWEDT